jgi:excisionase family DNA binding protein
VIKRYYSIREASEYMGYSPSYIYKITAAGTLPSFKIGESIRIDIDDIEKYMRAKRRDITRTVKQKSIKMYDMAV